MIQRDKYVGSFMLAVMLVGVVGLSLVNPVDVFAEEQNTPVSDGSFDIYVNYNDNNNSEWIKGANITGYNAFVALQAYCASVSKNLVADSSYTVNTSYLTINKNYGNVTTIGEKTEDTINKWNVFYVPTGTSEWQGGLDAIGFYKPFEDYDATMCTANVALFYGTAEQAIAAKNALPTDNLKSTIGVSSINNNSNFQVTFKVDFSYTDGVQTCVDWGTSTLSDGKTIVGYGSDAALALKNAVGTCNHLNLYLTAKVTNNNVTEVNTNYGYLATLYGVSEANADLNGDTVPDTYWYWSLYTGIGEGKTYADFLLGFYNPISSGMGTGYMLNQFTLTYSYSSWA